MCGLPSWLGVARPNGLVYPPLIHISSIPEWGTAPTKSELLVFAMVFPPRNQAEELGERQIDVSTRKPGDMPFICLNGVMVWLEDELIVTTPLDLP